MVHSVLIAICALTPVFAMAVAALTARIPVSQSVSWAVFRALSYLALLAAGVGWLDRLVSVDTVWHLYVPGLAFDLPTTWMALLVQLLGVVVGVFSARYLEGEPGQPRFISALASVLASVQLLLLADHWLVLIGAWAAVGLALQGLLCFYSDRPFALLAAYKKRIADRMADGLLLLAAALAWWQVGSGSFSSLKTYLMSGQTSLALQGKR